MQLPTFLRPLALTLVLAHLLMLLAGTAFSADETPTTKLPTDAAKLVEAFDADATKLRADVEKAIEKKAATLATALQKAQDAATKKGDLDAAMAIKAKVAALGVKGGEVTVPPFVGKWTAVWDRGNAGSNLAHEVWEIAADGTCTSGAFTGHWKPKAGGYEVSWDSLGIVDVIKSLGADNRTTAARSSGKIVSLQKQ